MSEIIQTSNQISEPLNSSRRELEAACRISKALFQHERVEELVEEALRTSLDVVGAEAGSVLLADPETKQLVFYHSVGEKTVTRGTRIPWTQGIAGSVFQSGQAVVIGDAKQDSHHFAGIDEATGLSTKDLIALPLKRWEGEPIGVLEVLNKRQGRLDEQDLAILSIISAFTALSIERSRLSEQAKIAEIVLVLGDIGHDIKNMLMPVLNGAWLLRDELTEHFGSLPSQDSNTIKASEALSHELIELITNNARRIQDRVKEIADAVKGVMSPPRFGPCRLTNLISTVYQTLEFPAKQKNISLQTEALETLPLIEADAGRLFNAFYNLINNAIPEVPTGGKITVRGRLDEMTKTVLLSVKDTGEGMPPEIRDSFFSSKTISRKVGGTGLGTKIVKDVVDSHAGSIWVESEEGIGTTFHIRLPVDQTSSRSG